MELYKEKLPDYFSGARYDLIKLIPKKEHQKILELGAGSCDTLIEIKRQGLADEVVAVELMPMAASNQGSQLIDKLIIANIEIDEIDLPDSYFDVIVCGDVLEHLIDPWKVVDRLTRAMKPGGTFVVSLPNIRVKSALKRILIDGDFGYQRDGIFDKSHFRFFCKKNMVDLFTTDQLSVTKIYPNYALMPNPPKKIVLFNKLTFNVFEEFFALQFLLVATRK